jgi:hypothetical protein
MKAIIESEFTFTAERVRMEELIEYLAPLDVLGNTRTLELYNRMKPEAAQPATTATLVKASRELLELLNRLRHLRIQGQPSGSSPLAPNVSAASTRFGEMLDHLDKALMPGGQAWVEQEYEDRLLDAEAHAADFRDLVALARRYCDAQLEALLNKLSRAFQKPDFCIYRGMLGSAAELQLRSELSWDEDWYTGMQIRLSDLDATADQP